MKKIVLGLLILLTGINTAFSQDEKQEIIDLSQMKWEWMANKDVANLAKLFDDESKFVHMSGSWRKARELEIIESGSIWYKEAIIHDTDVELHGDTAIIWS